MVYLLLVSVHFSRSPYLLKISGRGGIKKASASHNQLMSPQGLHFSPYSTAKTNFKAQISGKLVCSGINEVAFVSVSLDKASMKKCWIMIIIIMKKSQETSFFVGRQKLTSALKLMPEK